MSFEEAEEKIRPLRISSSREYRRLFRQKKLPKGLPSDRPKVYKNKGWIGWPEFLGYERDKMIRGSALPFKEARKITRSLAIKSISEYKKLHKRRRLPKGLPADPSRAYKDQGWVDWYDFLGNKRPDKFLLFEEAREIVRKLGICTIEDYTRFCRQGKLPRGLPICPNAVYKDKGWTSWPEYLGCKPRRGLKFLPFEEDREIIRSLNIISKREFNLLRKQGKLPAIVSGDPSRYYKDKWISWPDFLGYTPRKLKKGSAMPYEEAREIIRGMNFTSKDEYYKLSRQGKLPINIPRDPHSVYEGKSWISWPDFLGHEPMTNPLPFEEAKRIVRSLGIKSGVEYRKLSRQGKLPKGLPYAVYYTYRDQGWKGFYDFLGLEPPVKPLPFKEAVNIVRKLGIKSMSEYHRLHTLGRLPKGLPYEPDEVYKKENDE